MGDFYQDIRDRANQRRAAINNGLPNASTLGANPDQSDAAQRQRLANVAGATGGLYTGVAGIGGDIEALVKAIYRSNKERDVLGREKEGYRGLGAHIDDIYNSSDTFLTNSLDAREDVKNFVGDNKVGDLLSEASDNSWLTGEIITPVPTVAGVTKYGGKGLNLLDDGVTAANKVLNKYDIQPGLSIKDVSVDTFADQHKLYHGGNKSFAKKLEGKRFNALEKNKDSGSGGNRYGLSTTTKQDTASDFAYGNAGNDGVVTELYIHPEARVLNLDNPNFLDDMSEAELKKIAKDYDVIRDVNNTQGEGEYRILTDSILRDRSQLESYHLLNGNKTTLNDTGLGNNRATVSVPELEQKTSYSMPNRNPDSIDAVEARDKFWRTLNKKPDAPVNPDGIDATGYNPKVSDRALGNQRADVTVPNDYNNFNTIPKKDPYPALNRSSIGGQEEALLKQQGREFKFGVDKNRAWTEAFGNPTGTPKLNANRNVNPDLGLTYDGSEFPRSIDPRARDLTPNGQPAPVSPVKEQDILIDADGNFINQPAEGLNANAIKGTPEADLVGADGGLLNSSNSPLASMIESTAKIGEATRGRLQALPQGIKDIVNRASTKDEMIAILKDYRKKAKSKSVLTADDIKTLSSENLNRLNNTVRDNVNSAISDTHFTNRLDNTNEVPLTSNVKDVMDDLTVGMTNADAIADAKTVKNLYKDRFRNPDELMNKLTTKATELQAKTVSADNNKLINAIHHALIDVVNRNYKGVKPNVNSQLTKTANQYLNRVGMEITKGTDGLQVKPRNFNSEEQLFNEMGGKPKARNLDDYDNAQGYSTERAGLGKEYTESIDDVLKDLVKTSKQKPNKRVKRSQLTQKQDDALYTGEFPDYNQGRITK